MRRISIVVLLLVVACGDSAASITRTEFIAQANAICRTAQAESTRVSDGVFALLSPDATVEQAGAALQLSLQQTDAIFAAGLADLRALPVPDGDEELVAAMFDGMEAARAQVTALAAEYAAGNEQIPKILTGPDQPFADVNRRLLEYGLIECR